MKESIKSNVSSNVDGNDESDDSRTGFSDDLQLSKMKNPAEVAQALLQICGTSKEAIETKIAEEAVIAMAAWGKRVLVPEEKRNSNRKNKQDNEEVTEMESKKQSK